MFPLSSVLVLLAVAPAPPAPSPAAGLVLHEGHPAGFAVDGNLPEWKGLPPSLTLGASSQVAGKSPVASAEDLSATVWLAVGPQGLAIAGEVKDERVLLPTAGKREEVNADHVEVWLATRPPELPPLAFVNQFGDQEVPSPEACAEVASENPEGCRTWWKEQAERRKGLVRDFVAQYGLMAQEVVRFGRREGAGKARYEPMPGGYRFEALIPLAAFPRAAQAPLKELRVLVDLVDNDEGRARQESFLSSSAGRRFGEPETFHAVTLKAPLRSGTWPELLERVLEMQSGASYQPGPATAEVQVWLNPATGYQYTPDQPSPAVVTLPFARVERMAKLGNVEVVTATAEAMMDGAPGRWLVSRRGNTVLGTLPIGTDSVRSVPRPPGLHFLQIYEGNSRYLGTGACGACPMVQFTLLRMDASGKFSEPVNLEGGGGNGAEVEWKASPDLKRIEVFEVEGDPEAKDAKPRLVSRHTFNPKTGNYDSESFPRPSEEEGTP